MRILNNQIVNYIGLGSRADIEHAAGIESTFLVSVTNKIFDIGKPAIFRLYSQNSGKLLNEWITVVDSSSVITWTISNAELLLLKPLDYFIEATYETELLFYGTFKLNKI